MFEGPGGDSRNRRRTRLVGGSARRGPCAPSDFHRRDAPRSRDGARVHRDQPPAQLSLLISSVCWSAQSA